MKSRLLLLAALLSLPACTDSGDNPYHASNSPRIVGDGLSVVIVRVKTEEEAKPFADQYCKHYGRAAQFKEMMRYRYSRTTANSASFDCIARSGQREDS